MKAPTYVAFGLLCATSAFSLAGLSLPSNGPALGGVVLGSLLPDLDSPKSALARVLPFLALQGTLPTTQHQPVQLHGQILSLAFAPRPLLASLHPVRRADPEHLDQLRTQVQDLAPFLEPPLRHGGCDSQPHPKPALHLHRDAPWTGTTPF